MNKFDAILERVNNARAAAIKAKNLADDAIADLHKATTLLMEMKLASMEQEKDELRKAIKK